MENKQLQIQEIQSIGQVMKKSGLFSDLQSPEQAMVKIMAGQMLGVDPFGSTSGIHIIKGKPVISANLMAGLIKRSGKYDYKAIKHDETLCHLEFYRVDGKKEAIGESIFSMDDAKKAGLSGGNWAKYPKNMLFARAISNGFRYHCADLAISGGVYVEGELDDDKPMAEPEPKNVTPKNEPEGLKTSKETIKEVFETSKKHNETPLPIGNEPAQLLSDARDAVNSLAPEDKAKWKNDYIQMFNEPPRSAKDMDADKLEWCISWVAELRNAELNAEYNETVGGV